MHRYYQTRLNTADRLGRFRRPKHRAAADRHEKNANILQKTGGCFIIIFLKISKMTQTHSLHFQTVNYLGFVSKHLTFYEYPLNFKLARSLNNSGTAFNKS